MSVFEAVGEHARGQDRRRRSSSRSSARPVPGAGCCGGMFTANTMSSAIEAMGMSLPGSSTMAAEDAEKAASAARVGRGAAWRRSRAAAASAPDHDPQGVRERDRGGHGDRRLDQRRAAPAGHRPRRAACRSRSTTSRRSARGCRCSCDLKPSGRYVATDLHRAGGIPQVMKMLLAHGLLHGDCLTITGKTMAENLEGRAGRAARRSGRDPALGPAALRAGAPRDPARATSRPRARWRRSRGVKTPRMTGPARVFESEERCLEAILAGTDQGRATWS